MEELKQKIITDCNESQLPLEALFFVVKDALRDIEDALRAFKEQQKQEQEEMNNEETSENVEVETEE